MQSFWDSQFKFSEVLPDFTQQLDLMSSQSDHAATQLELERASYGEHDRQWVEWAYGSDPKHLLPVIVHGGYWRALSAEMHRFMMPSFLEHAGQVANLEYRLMPEVRLTDVVADVAAGLTALATHFPDAELVPIGHSAGANLVLCAMETPHLSARTKGVIALSGVYDLAPVALSFLQAELQLTSEEIETYSLRPKTGRPPALYVNGSAETYEYRRGGALMASKGPAAWRVIDGADHMSLVPAACKEAKTLLSHLKALEQ